MQSVARALRALVRLREPDAARREIHLTSAGLDPPSEHEPMVDPPTERVVEIPMYLEP